MRCPVCNKVLPSNGIQQQVHINDCLDWQQRESSGASSSSRSKPPSVLAALSDDDESDDDFVHDVESVDKVKAILNDAKKQKKTKAKRKREAVTSKKDSKRKRKRDESAVDVRAEKLRCLFCDKSLDRSGVPGRLKHLRQCGKAHNVDPDALAELLQSATASSRSSSRVAEAAVKRVRKSSFKVHDAAAAAAGVGSGRQAYARSLRQQVVVLNQKINVLEQERDEVMNKLLELGEPVQAQQEKKPAAAVEWTPGVPVTPEARHPPPDNVDLSRSNVRSDSDAFSTPLVVRRKAAPIVLPPSPGDDVMHNLLAELQESEEEGGNAGQDEVISLLSPDPPPKPKPKKQKRKKQKKKKKKDDEVMPDYASKTDKQLKKIMSGYGLKSMTRKRMIKQLEEIWHALHPGAAVDANENEQPKLAKGAAQAAAEAAEAVDPKQVRRERKLKRDADARRLLFEMIRGTDELYEHILLFQPLELQDLQKVMRTAGIKLNKNLLMAALDEWGVAFTNTKARRGRSGYF